MSWITGCTVTCPHCGHIGPGRDFDPSCADECFCPSCGAGFLCEPEDDDAEDEA